MNREDVIRMARESSFTENSGFDGCFVCNPHSLERFAALVVAAEREACAKVCETNADDGSEGDWDSACNNCAYHIRARGEKDAP